MALTFQEELQLQVALREIRLERRAALREMFKGTQLKVKSWASDAKEIAKEAKNARKQIKKIPGVDVPEVEVGLPNFDLPNFDLFKGLRFDVDLPSLRLPQIRGFDLIPDFRIGDLPGFSLDGLRIPTIRLRDLPKLPDLSLRVLIGQLCIRFPDLSLPSIVFEVGKILNIDLPDLLFGFKVEFPEFFEFDWKVKLPNVNVPDVNFRGIPMPDLPEIDLRKIKIEGLDLSKYLHIPGFDKVLRLLVELFDIADLPEIIVDLGGLDVLTDFITSALPIVQQVKSGSKAAYHAGKAAQEYHKSRKVKQHKKGLLPGDARSAADAVRRLLRESSGEYATTAAIETTQFTVSTVGLFADLGAGTGPAVSAGASLAKLTQKIVMFGVKYKEYKKVNALLASTPEEQLSHKLFNTSPLLGCYFLVNSTTSNVLNVLSSDILSDDWMTDAERNKRKHLDPLIKDAQRFIDKSRYVLFPIRQDKGMYVELSTMEKLKGRFTLAFKKKFGRAPQNAVAPTHRNIGQR